MTNRKKVWRGGRPNSGVSNPVHTKRKIPNKYKEDNEKSIFQTDIHKAKNGKCALYLILYIYIYIIFYQLKGLILTPWTEYVFNKSKNK